MVEQERLGADVPVGRTRWEERSREGMEQLTLHTLRLVCLQGHSSPCAHSTQLAALRLYQLHQYLFEHHSTHPANSC
jgi:hypothetical protein